MKVTLRQKKIANKKISLYLDFYPALKDKTTGKETRREFLKLYLYEKPKTSLERKHNKETKALAENIRAKRQIAVQNGNYDFLGDTRGNLDFLAFFEKIVQEKKEKTSKNNYANYRSTYKYLHQFSNGELLVKDINEKFVLEFKEYLLDCNQLQAKDKKLSQNSAHSYFSKFRAALKIAFQKKLIKDNPASRVQGVKQEYPYREFLTIEEIQLLANTECEKPIIKKAALFSAFTGLRWSDVQKLHWSDLHYSEDLGHYLVFTQQKTDKPETHPISEQAVSIIGARQADEERIFKGLKYSAWQNLKIREWVLRAGIDKKITFHNFRHTYASLLIYNGVDIYTVSKMLGHKHLKTTEIYTKVMDSKKVDAAKAIPNIKL